MSDLKKALGAKFRKGMCQKCLVNPSIGRVQLNANEKTDIPNKVIQVASLSCTLCEPCLIKVYKNAEASIKETMDS